jgi:hypothetical protein
VSQAASGAGRISRAYFPSREGQLSPPGGNAFMFVRDVPLGIMPSRHDDGDFAVSLDPPDPVVQERVIALLEIGQFSRHGLREALVDFVETLAQDIAFSGECYFEIADPHGAEEARRLLILPSGIIRHRGASYMQVVPQADRRAGEPAEIEIPAERIWHVTLPPALGSPEEHRALLRELERLGMPVPGFALEGERFGAEAGFDFATSRRAMDVAVERATRRWGTIPSFQRVKGTTEYYMFARRLQWNHAQALLREHIVAGLDGLLDRLGLGRLDVRGLPSASEQALTIKRLQRGEISVEDALATARI